MSIRNDSIVELKEDFLLIVTGVTPSDAAVIIGDPDVAKIIICDRIGQGACHIRTCCHVQVHVHDGATCWHGPT